MRLSQELPFYSLTPPRSPLRASLIRRKPWPLRWPQVLCLPGPPARPPPPPPMALVGVGVRSDFPRLPGSASGLAEKAGRYSGALVWVTRQNRTGLGAGWFLCPLPLLWPPPPGPLLGAPLSEQPVSWWALGLFCPEQGQPLGWWARWGLTWIWTVSQPGPWWPSATVFLPQEKDGAHLGHRMRKS